MIGNLVETDSIVKEKIIKYFKGAKEVEEYLGRYMTVKDKPDIGFRQKEHLYKSLNSTLTKNQESEKEYKSIVMKANGFISKFVQKMEELTKQLCDLERVRVEAVHSAINKFVVYEKFSEMNNKYDIGNFSKVLDEFNNEKEVAIIEEKLAKAIGNGSNPQRLKYNFSPYQTDLLDLEKFNISNIEAPVRTSPEKENKKNDIMEMFSYVMNIDK